jgi:hypothetical protein
MPFVQGFLRIRRGGHPDQGLPGGEGPVDPDYGIDEGAGIDNSLPGLPPYPDQGLPRPPAGVWPPLTPSHPIQPAPPGTPPGTIWPPVWPVDPGYGRPIGGHPDQGLPPTGGHPDQGLPGAPAHPDQGLPDAPPTVDNTLPGGPVRPDQGLPKPQVYYVVCGIPGVGWRYIAVDPTLRPSHPIAPYPQPK